MIDDRTAPSADDVASGIWIDSVFEITPEKWQDGKIIKERLIRIGIEYDEEYVDRVKKSLYCRYSAKKREEEDNPSAWEDIGPSWRR